MASIMRSYSAASAWHGCVQRRLWTRIAITAGAPYPPQLIGVGHSDHVGGQQVGKTLSIGTVGLVGRVG